VTRAQRAADRLRALRAAPPEHRAAALDAWLRARDDA